jgi:phosphate/sulfate permease
VRNDTVLVLVVITALAFDFTNGFHDTGNAMATSIATGALGPRTAVAISVHSTSSARSCPWPWRPPSPTAW